MIVPVMEIHHTVMILSFRIDLSEQTVQTQIRLLLEEQSDQGLHCLPFCLHLLDTFLYGKVAWFRIYCTKESVSGVRIFKIFTNFQISVTYNFVESYVFALLEHLVLLYIA